MSAPVVLTNVRTPYRSCWTILKSPNRMESKARLTDNRFYLSVVIHQQKNKSCIIKIYRPWSSPEPSIIILLQVRGDAPLHRTAPAPQLQSVSCLHTDALSHLLKLPSVQHLYVSHRKSSSRCTKISQMQWFFCVDESSFKGENCKKWLNIEGSA